MVPCNPPPSITSFALRSLSLSLLSLSLSPHLLFKVWILYRNNKVFTQPVEETSPKGEHAFRLTNSQNTWKQRMWQWISKTVQPRLYKQITCLFEVSIILHSIGVDLPPAIYYIRKNRKQLLSGQNMTSFELHATYIVLLVWQQVYSWYWAALVGN